MSRHAELVARDLAAVWHPCTQMQDHEALPPLVIRSARGAWLTDADDRRYLDAISSWWVNLLGHADPRLDAALRTQLGQLEHVILAGFSHEPVIELSERLLALAPPGLARCFYADSGSAAVEVALKMSFHHWLNAGQGERTRFVTLANSYHGETLGALAVGDVALYKRTYDPLLMRALTTPSPDAWARAPGEDWLAPALRAADALDALLAERGREVCALIVEPLVQCAGGMRMYHPEFLRRARRSCDRYGVHLIADEVAVGFGRTGTLFACEQAGITPDFLCLGKGLTGGYLPLSVVLTTAQVYQSFYAEWHTQRAFLHSHSYTGNALACRAALATLDALAADDVVARNHERARLLGAAAASLADHPQVGEVRQTGMILAIEMVRERASRAGYDPRERRGRRVYQHALARGVLLRPLGDVIYFMPPYCIDAAEIALLGAVAAEGVALATRP